MNKNNIEILFESHQWEKLADSYKPDEIIKTLSFKNGLRLAYQLLYNDKWDANLQEYSVKLLYEIRKVYLREWNACWGYDALLGQACYLTCKHDERYESYKRAFNKTQNPPPRLLIEFARSCICPGKPPISYDDAIDLAKRAIKDAAYSDGIGLLSNIYSLKDDYKNEAYWTKILKNSDQDFISPSIEPKFLVEEYLREIKKDN